jgi:hypothetical protein
MSKLQENVLIGVIHSLPVIAILVAVGTVLVGCKRIEEPAREMTAEEKTEVMADAVFTSQETTRVTVKQLTGNGPFVVYLTTDNVTNCQYLSMVSGSGTNTEQVPNTCK